MIWTDLSLRNEIHIESKGNFTRLTWGEQCHTFEPEVRSHVWTSRFLATCLSLKKVKVTRLDLKGKATRARINSFLNLCIDCRSVRLICLKKSWSICLENHLSIKKTITQFFHQEINHFLFIKKFIKRFIIIYLDQPISIFCCNSWFFWS